MHEPNITDYTFLSWQDVGANWVGLGQHVWKRAAFSFLRIKLWSETPCFAARLLRGKAQERRWKRKQLNVIAKMQTT